MATPIQKLRRELLLQKKKEETPSIRISVTHKPLKMNEEKSRIVNEIIKNKKMTIDDTRLENTIQKAATFQVKKKEIVHIDFIPSQPTVAKVVTEVKICEAMNLNGTPCKCRAKIGKFCAKHAP